MARCLSWGAIILATTMVVLGIALSYSAPGEGELLANLVLLTGVLAPLVAVAGLLLAKRGGERAPRVARIALAFGIGAFSWPLLLFGPDLFCSIGSCY